MDYAEWVKQNRLRLQLSQQSLADRADLSVEGIGKIERRESPNPTDITQAKLRAAFGVPFPDLVDLGPKPEESAVPWYVERRKKLAQAVLSLMELNEGVADDLIYHAQIERSQRKRTGRARRA